MHDYESQKPILEVLIIELSLLTDFAVFRKMLRKINIYMQISSLFNFQ